MDARLKAEDELEAKTLVLNRRIRDFNKANKEKNNANANLASNQQRVAYEKDQLERGENQDRLKFVNEDTVEETSRINGQHDDRWRANGRLMKSLASPGFA